MWVRFKAWGGRRLEGIQDQVFGQLAAQVIFWGGVVLLALLVAFGFIIWGVIQSLAPPVVGLVGFLAFAGTTVVVNAIDGMVARRRRPSQTRSDALEARAETTVARKQKPSVESDGLLWVLDHWKVNKDTGAKKMALIPHCPEHRMRLLYWDEPSDELQDFEKALYYGLLRTPDANLTMHCPGPAPGGAHVFELAESGNDWKSAVKTAEVRMYAVLGGTD